MLQKLRIISVLFIPLMIAFFADCDGGGGGLSINDPAVVRTTFEGAESDSAFITIPFQSDEEEGFVTNTAVDFNGDGVFASYPVNGETQEEWVVQNAPMIITDSSYTVYFTVVDPDIMPGDEVLVRVALSDMEVASPWDGTVPAGAESLDSLVTIGALDRENLVDPEPGFTGAGGGVSLAEAQGESGFATPEDVVKTMPDGTVVFMRKGLPDTPQQFNTCVGNSIANSLSWLARKCSFEDRFQFKDPSVPNDPPIKLDVNSSSDVGSIADLLIESFKTVPEATLTTPTGDFGGVRNSKVLEAKNKFAADLGLPIVSSVKTRTGGLKFEDIKKAMNDGCDVEVFVQFLDIDTGSQLNQGHAVSLSGYSESSKSKGLTFHDPGTKTTNDVYNNITETAKGALAFPYTFMNKKRTALVEMVLIECCLMPPAPSPTAGIMPPSPSPSTGIMPPPSPSPSPSPSPTPTPAFTGGEKSQTIIHMRGSSPCPQSFPITVELGLENVDTSCRVKPIGTVPAWLKIPNPIPVRALSDGSLSAGFVPKFTCTGFKPGKNTVTIQFTCVDKDGNVKCQTPIKVTLTVDVR